MKNFTEKYAIVIGVGQLYGMNIGSDNDAREMTTILKQYGFHSKNIKTFLNKKATYQNVLDALDWLKAKENENATVLFFFSGHGGHGAMRIWDANLHGLILKNAFENFSSKRIIFLVHSCYAGAIIPYLEGENRIVVTSSDADHVSVDGRRYSIWGYRFLHEGIKRGKADENGDGLVSIEEAYRYCGLGVMSDKIEGDVIL